MKRLLKLLTLAIPVLGIALSFVYHTSSIKPALASASDTAIYGTNSQPGYFSSSETSSFNPTHYTKTNGFYYPGMINDFEGVFTPTLSASSISIRAPFIAPYIADGYQHRYGLYQSVYAGEVPWVDANDVWYTSDVSNDMQPYLDKTGITFTGVPLGSTSSQTIPVSSVTSQVSSGNRVSIQGLTINTSMNLYNYSSITLNLGTVRYVSMVESYKEEEGLYSLNYETEIIPSTYTTLSFEPSSQGVITGDLITNLTNEIEWYEGPYHDGAKKSYKDKSVLIAYLYNKLEHDIKNSLKEERPYSNGGYFAFSPSETYSDSFDYKQSFSKLYPVEGAHFEHGHDYDIYVVPDYTTSTSSSNIITEISNVYALPANDDEFLENYINKQVRILVKTCNVFDDNRPATPVSNEQSVLFEGYDFIKNATITNSRSATYKFFDIDHSDIQTYEADKNETYSLSEPKSLYTFQHKMVGETPSTITYKTLFSADNLTPSGWLKEATPSGTSSFVSIWRSFFIGGLDTNFYVTTSGENNKVTFSSRDKLFVRVTKGDERNFYIGETRYNVSDSGYASTTAIPPSEINNECDFSEPGEYIIDLINRSDSSKTTKILKIYDEKDLNVTTTKDTNFELDVSLLVPGGSLDGIKIYESTTKSGYPTKQSKVEEISVLDTGELNEQGFEQLNKDDEDRSIVSANKNYVFKEEGSLVNQFRKTYYVEVTVLNKTKAFYVYWNYIPPQADTIDVVFTQWNSKEGEETTYTVNVCCSSGETPTPESKFYDVELIAENNCATLDLDNRKIIATAPGEVYVTFTLQNGKDSIQKHFTIVENPDLHPQPDQEPGGDSSSENPPGDPSSEPSSENPSSSEPSSSETPDDPGGSSEATPTPEDITNSNATAVIIIIAAVGVVIIGTLVFVIIRARRTGGMKK